MLQNIRRIIIALLGALWVSMSAQAVDFDTDWAQFGRYAKANAELKENPDVVFMGNSITDFWVWKMPEFWEAHPRFVDRGISGQTTSEMLVRFRQDVIDLHPKVVVINYGTNDIAENTGPYDEDLTFGNVCSMVELARYHKIKVVLASCLPAGGFGWRRSITDSMEKIRSLNERVKAYAKENKIPYVDYFSAMVNAEGTAMRADYANDNPGVHPNAAGYAVMEGLLLPVIEKLR